MGRKRVVDPEEADFHLDIDLEDQTLDPDAEYVMGAPRRQPVADDDAKVGVMKAFQLKGLRYSHKVEGEDVDDGEAADAEEELEAIEADKMIQRRLHDDDFLLPGMDKLTVSAKKAAKKTEKEKGKSSVDLLFAVDASNLETIDKDFKAATDDQKLKLLAKDSPELLQLLEEYKKHMHTVKSVLAPVLAKVRNGDLKASAGMSFLHMKFHLLLLYCMHIVFYMSLKVEGKQVKDHPVIQKLVELRVYMQKLNPLEKKLKYTIERLLAASNLDPDAIDSFTTQAADEEDESLLRPKMENLMPLNMGGIVEEAEDDKKLYKAPKAVTSIEDQVAKKKKERRAAQKLKADIEAYEESNFKPYNLTRAEKKLLKAAEKTDEQHLADCMQKEEKFDGEVDADDEDMALLQFLEKKQRVVSNLRQREDEELAALSRKVLANDMSAADGGDEEIPSGDEMSEGEGADGAEEGEEEDGEGGTKKKAKEDPEEDPYYRQQRMKAEEKKQRLKERLAKRKLQSMEGATEEDAPDRKRRAAGKKILQNRGLTPSNKKGLHPRLGIKRRYQKQLARRHSQVKEYSGSQYNTYAGERKISDHVIRARKLS